MKRKFLLIGIWGETIPSSSFFSFFINIDEMDTLTSHQICFSENLPSPLEAYDLGFFVLNRCYCCYYYFYLFIYFFIYLLLTTFNFFPQVSLMSLASFPCLQMFYWFSVIFNSRSLNNYSVIEKIVAGPHSQNTALFLSPAPCRLSLCPVLGFPKTHFFSHVPPVPRRAPHTGRVSLNISWMSEYIQVF